MNAQLDDKKRQFKELMSFHVFNGLLFSYFLTIIKTFTDFYDKKIVQIFLNRI